MEKQVLEPIFDKDQIEKAFKKLNIDYDSHDISAAQYGKTSRLFSNVFLDEEKIKDFKLTFTKGASGKPEITFDFKEEKLMIPSKIGKHRITEQEKKDLEEGNFISISATKSQSLMMRLDMELNKVIINTNKVLNAPAKIQGYKLSKQDKLDFANHKPLKPKVYYNEKDKQYYTVNIRLNEDGKTLEFTNYKALQEKEALRLKEKLNVEKKSDGVAKNHKLENVLNSVSEIENTKEGKAEEKNSDQTYTNLISNAEDLNESEKNALQANDIPLNQVKEIKVSNNIKHIKPQLLASKVVTTQEKSTNDAAIQEYKNVLKGYNKKELRKFVSELKETRKLATGKVKADFLSLAEGQLSQKSKSTDKAQSPSI